MATAGVNLATTKDGETYNKLQRPADYLTSTTPHAPSVTTVPSAIVHSGKRKREQDSGYGSKRARTGCNAADSTNTNGRLRAGVRTALPVLDEEEQPSDEFSREASAYIRGVMSEASTKTLLVAPTSPDAHRGFCDDKHLPYTRTIDSQHVVFQEGVCIAVDNGYEYMTEYWDEDYLDPHESCHRLILQRFLVLRHRLTEGKGDSIPDSECTGRPGLKREWPEIVERIYPALDEVLHMDESTLYTAIRGCVIALGNSTTVSPEKSCWIWTLLASTGDLGTLDHGRISKIRDLGLAAGRLGTRLRAAQDCDGRSNSGGSKNSLDHSPGDNGVAVRDDGDMSESDGEMAISEDLDEVGGLTGDRSLESARARLLAQLGDRLVPSGMSAPVMSPAKSPQQNFHHLSRAEAERQRQEMRKQGRHDEQALRAGPAASDREEAGSKDTDRVPLSESDWNTKATIDMILTVVAECYGQKDLLRYREAW
ncbi:hypothetical protein BDW02DRAFT_585759 [Decorospora gaudefroyi]|uniref:Uncharacterized protein n=1 Tax=Decorospora gaudefroyi TaxID=184978 RepID=A0A6A5KSP1_9PLEO|nr:hypothetical protein BDW02DRAFT_585759 [Decorospora gaudefroyi]